MSSSLMQEAYKHLRTKLLRGELAAGERLSTLAIARELEISNMPIREALRQLHAEGLVEHRPHAGCVVRSLDVAELEELYEFREMLECFAAAQCAQHISRKDLGELEDICLQMRDVACDAREAEQDQHAELFCRISETDVRFHQTLIRAAGNRWVARAAENIVPISQLLPNQRLPAWASPLWAAARHYRIHTTILKAIRRGDAEQVRPLMKAHVRCGHPLYEVKRLKFPGGMETRRREANEG